MNPPLLASARTIHQGQRTTAIGSELLFSNMNTSLLFASVNSGCPWLDEHIKSFIKKYSPNIIFTKDLRCFINNKAALFYICDGQRFNTNDFIIPLKNPNSSLINVYLNNDALIRKNYLFRIIEYWIIKRPESILKSRVLTII
jgi:tubulin---tyrosine ligase